jgi:hypothetical protein
VVWSQALAEADASAPLAQLTQARRARFESESSARRAAEARLEKERSLQTASESAATLDGQIAAETEAKLAAVKEAIQHRRVRVEFEARGRKAAEVRARVEVLAARAAREWAEGKKRDPSQAQARSAPVAQDASETPRYAAARFLEPVGRGRRVRDAPRSRRAARRHVDHRVERGTQLLDAARADDQPVIGGCRSTPRPCSSDGPRCAQKARTSPRSVHPVLAM